jgi:EmrB/QacA subfamily drug resistance transporter
MNQRSLKVVSPRAQLLVVSFISSLVMLDSNVVAVALPTIARTFNADFADVQWVITAYVLPFAALLLGAGSFGDRFGRRLAALIGLVIFGASSLACGLAVSPTMLNISRAFQGAGASLVLTASLALLNQLFVGAERAKAFAFWGASLGVAITSGPIIGGVIASLFGWTWAFLINIPICIALFVAALRIIPESNDPDATGLDYAGIATFTSGLFLVTWSVIDGNSVGWFSAPILWRLLGGIALLVLFVVVELRQERPMLDLAIFRSRHFIGTVFAMVGYAVGAQVMIFYLPLYLQNAFGFSPMISGIAMLPFALPMFLVPRISVGIRWLPRNLLVAGLGISMLANIAMAVLASHRAPYWAFALAMTLAGVGAGVLNGDTAKALQGALPLNRSGVASGIGATTRFVALLFGVAGFGAILVSSTANKFSAMAHQAGLSVGEATNLAKKFAAGDVDIASSPLGIAAHGGLKEHLLGAFQSGFNAAAFAAALAAAICLVLTYLLMDGEHRATVAAGASESVFIPGE